MPTPPVGAERTDETPTTEPAAPLWHAKPLRRVGDGWLDRWLRTTSDLARLQSSHPMVDAVVDEVDGRLIRIGNRWLVDFASSSYLGFDQEPELLAAVPEYLAKWGSHPGWSRLVGSPALYLEVEERLKELLGSEDALLLPTISLVHSAVIPVLAGEGTIFLDARAHKTIFDGCTLARSHGATLKRFPHGDVAELERLLRWGMRGPRVICIDGVNSMTGNAPDLPALARLAREYDALLYVDDAHGFGVVGERADDELCDYGKRGNGVVRHLGESYDNVVLVGGFSKAYSSMLAFVACPTPVKRMLKTAATPYTYSGPTPVASLATAIEGLKLNQRRGDELRRDVHDMTTRVLDAMTRLGIAPPNASGSPIVEIPLANPAEIDAVGAHLFERGIFATMAAYPLVPRDEVGFRLQVTAANTREQVEGLIAVLGELTDRFRFRSALERAA